MLLTTSGTCSPVMLVSPNPLLAFAKVLFARNPPLIIRTRFDYANSMSTVPYRSFARRRESVLPEVRLEL